MAASASFCLDDGIFTRSCIAVLALRTRISMSAIGSVIIVQSPPPSPARLRHAGDLAGVDQFAKTDAAQHELAVHRLRTTAALAPRVRAHLELGLALLLLDECLLGHLLLALPAEWKAEGIEQSPAFGVGTSGGHDRDVHAPRDVDAVVVDLREDQLLGDAERVVAAAVELRGQAAEVTDAGNGDADEAIEELPHAVAAQRDLGADGIAFTQLEAGDRLLRLRHDGLLPGDDLEIAHGGFEQARLLHGTADAHVEHDLLEARDLHDVADTERLLERGADLVVVPLLEPGRDRRGCFGRGHVRSAPHFLQTRRFVPSVLNL